MQKLVILRTLILAAAITSVLFAGITIIAPFIDETSKGGFFNDRSSSGYLAFSFLIFAVSFSGLIIISKKLAIKR